MSSHDKLILYAKEIEGGNPNHSRRMNHIQLSNGSSIIPDLISETKYVECEVTTNKHKYEHVNKKKKILYVGIQAIKHFDEVKIFDLDITEETTTLIPLLELEPPKTKQPNPLSTTLNTEQELVTDFPPETEYEKAEKKKRNQEIALYHLKIQKKALEKKLDTEDSKVNVLQDRLNELKKRNEELSTELKQLAFIRVNLGIVTLDPKNTFECCMCDERANVEITINDVKYGLCDFHFKNVIGNKGNTVREERTYRLRRSR